MRISLLPAHRRALGLACAVSLVFSLCARPLLAQEKKQKKGQMEEFEETDPYTGGERAKLEQLGYQNFGPFLWHASELTSHVQETMGGIEILWVETEHFKIGSSLVTYKIPNDREEKARIATEVATFRERLGKVKVKFPRKELDPWLRLHLYAQRAERLYADFSRDFVHDPGARVPAGPHLGNPNKFLLLLCQRKSEFGRYARAYHEIDTPYSYRTGWPEDCMFFGLNMEAIKESYDVPGEKPFDSMLYARVAGNLAANFVDGFAGHFFSAPAWFTVAAEHLYARRVAPRWTASAGLKVGETTDDDDWEWEERVAGLVKNEFYAKTFEVFGWTREYELNRRDHMIVWSKLDYLTRAAEGEAPAFLDSILVPVRDMSAGSAEELRERQTQALMAHYSLSPDEFDEAWKAWVKKNYR